MNMKPSFKTLTLIAAIGMTAFTIYLVTRYFISEFYPMSGYYDLWHDIRDRLILDIPLVVLLGVCFSLWRYRPTNNVSRTFCYLSIGLFGGLVVTLLFSPFFIIQNGDAPYLLPSIVWRATLLIMGVIWFFMLMRQPMEETSPGLFRKTLVVAIILLALPMVLEIISGIALLGGREIVLGLRSTAIKTWVKFVVPVLLLAHIVYAQLKDDNVKRRRLCTPRTLIGLCVSIISLCVITVCIGLCHHFFHSNPVASLIVEGVAFVLICVILCLCGASWVMLSIMAFRQLPHPLGYKIFNIASQIITIGSLLATIFCPSEIEDLFIVLFLISFCAFFLTTTVRAILYSIPKQQQQ